MTPFGPPERHTQTRVLDLFRNDLGYRYLGDWTSRDGNSNVEEDLLSRFLEGRGLSPQQINRTLDLIRQPSRLEKAFTTRTRPSTASSAMVSR